jgi:hypothetical protein
VVRSELAAFGEYERQEAPQSSDTRPHAHEDMTTRPSERPFFGVPACRGDEISVGSGRVSGMVTAVAQEDLLEEFAERGVVRLSLVFSDDDGTAMREVVWQSWAARHGVDPRDPVTWLSVPQWKVLPHAKRHPAFRAILGPLLVDVADTLLGRDWTASTGFGNLLASFPDSDQWHLPGNGALWHSDFGYTTPMQPLPALRVFAVFGETPASGGGTLLVAGSHRMIDRFVHDRPEIAARRAKEARSACHRSNPWLDELTRGRATDPARAARFMGTVTDVHGIPAQVVEACGQPGDVFVCHPWTIHCRPPNAGSGPRFLRSPTLSRFRPVSAEVDPR